MLNYCWVYLLAGVCVGVSLMISGVLAALLDLLCFRLLVLVYCYGVYFNRINSVALL